MRRGYVLGAAALVVLIAAVGVVVVARTGHSASSVPTPTPTIRPLPTPTSLPLGERHAISDAVIAFLHNYNASLSFGSCGAMASVAIGEALRDARASCAQLQVAGARQTITEKAAPVVQSITVSGNSAKAVVVQYEDSLYFTRGCSVPDDTIPCRAASPQTQRGQFSTVTYHLRFYKQNWIVSSFSVGP